ncbi:hypothetical protein Tco_1384768 [Tanacetum coccineum]
MGDENPIRTLGDYSKPNHEGYKNTIELPVGNNVVLLRSDTIRLVQNGCSFHKLWSEDPNQHLKDFLKLLAIGLNVFQQDSSPYGRILLLISLLNSFHPEGPQNFATISLCSNNIKENSFLKHRLTNHYQSASGKLCDRNAKESWELLEDLALYDNESWNNPRDFAKPVKAISLPQDVSSTSDRRLIKLENQVQCLTEAHFARTQPTQVYKITTLCDICSGPHDAQYCMEDPEQAFVEYASSCTNEAVEFVCTKWDDGDVMFIEIVKKNDDSHKEEPKAGGLEEVDIIKKIENQAKMTKLSMEWKRLCKIKAKVQKCQSQSQYRRISSQTGAGLKEYILNCES